MTRPTTSMMAEVTRYCVSLTANVKSGGKEEVEGRHAQHGGERGGDATEAHGHDHDAEQVDHDDVGELEAREHEPGEQRGREHGSDRGRGGPRPAARWAHTASPC